MNILHSLSLPLALTVALHLIPAPARAQYSLVWQDEFDGTSADPARWEFQIGTGCPSLCRWGDNELQYDRAENATVAGGFLTITAPHQSASFLVVAGPTPVARTGEAPRFTVRIEGGPAWQSLNDVQIPNDASGTRFSLYDLAGSGPWPAARAYLTWRAGERHALRVLVAPFSITENGVPDRAIDFAGASHAAGVRVEATYRFNSYRLSYRYRLHEGDRWTWWTGFTAKVRDAKIELDQGAVTSRKTDLGFVPLLHVAGDWRFAPRWRLSLDADALAGGPGRAEDVALTLGRDLGDAWTLTAGYRTVEGGASVDEVYAFAWLHYAVVGIERRF